jgi:two-component system response regulator FixJ
MPSDAVVHVVDDDEAVRESLAFLLRTAQIEVKTYDSAVTFLRDPPAGGCVVTDVRMPEVSGIDLLGRLRELGMATPVIVITGHGDVPLAVEAMKLGAADFFEKPFDDDALLAAVRTALAKDGESSKSNIERAKISELGISPRTVEIYRANVMTKMDAASLSELVRMVLVIGMLGGADAPKGPR